MFSLHQQVRYSMPSLDRQPSDRLHILQLCLVQLEPIDPALLHKIEAPRLMRTDSKLRVLSRFNLVEGQNSQHLTIGRRDPCQAGKEPPSSFLKLLALGSTLWVLASGQANPYSPFFHHQ